jgi:ribonucleotide monophosphatase NagD (HAD superfamily)
MVLGGQGLAQELRDCGIETVAPTQFGLEVKPDAVVVGVDFALRYERLSLAAEAVRRGARFVATNRDAVYPGADALKAGAGSIVAALATAAGRDPDLVVGKPGPTLFLAAACGRVPVESAVVIGDGCRPTFVRRRRSGPQSVDADWRRPEHLGRGRRMRTRRSSRTTPRSCRHPGAWAVL